MCLTIQKKVKTEKPPNTDSRKCAEPKCNNVVREPQCSDNEDNFLVLNATNYTINFNLSMD